MSDESAGSMGFIARLIEAYGNDWENVALSRSPEEGFLEALPNARQLSGLVRRASKIGVVEPLDDEGNIRLAFRTFEKSIADYPYETFQVVRLVGGDWKEELISLVLPDNNKTRIGQRVKDSVFDSTNSVYSGSGLDTDFVEILLSQSQSVPAEYLQEGYYPLGEKMLEIVPEDTPIYTVLAAEGFVYRAVQARGSLELEQLSLDRDERVLNEFLAINDRRKNKAFDLTRFMRDKQIFSDTKVRLVRTKKGSEEVLIGPLSIDRPEKIIELITNNRIREVCGLEEEFNVKGREYKPYKILTNRLLREAGVDLFQGSLDNELF